VVKRELIFCEYVDFEFLTKANFSFFEKLENLGCMSLFDLSNEAYPQLIILFYANFEKVKPKGRIKTYYTTKVKVLIITVTVASNEGMFYLNPNLSKFPPQCQLPNSTNFVFRSMLIPIK